MVLKRSVLLVPRESSAVWYQAPARLVPTTTRFCSVLLLLVTSMDAWGPVSTVPSTRSPLPSSSKRAFWMEPPVIFTVAARLSPFEMSTEAPEDWSPSTHKDESVAP